MKKENEVNAVENRIKEAEAAKHTIKDSVFTNLFKEKKYLLQLYKTLHPEDTEVTEDALSDITIHNIMTDGIYNDLGFRRACLFLWRLRRRGQKISSCAV